MKKTFFSFFLVSLATALQAQISCPPNLPLTLVGNTEYCIGTNGVDLSVEQLYAGYEWLPTSETGQDVFLTAGSYEVVVTHYTGCTDTLEFEVEQVSNPPQPTVTANGPTEFCAGESVTLSGPAGYPYYFWSSGSISQNITVYESTTLVLSVEDFLGCQSSSNAIQVIVNPLPTAIVSPDLEGYGIEFNNLSINATSYLWNFGDGTTSTDFEPTHEYTLDGEVGMYMVAINDCGTDTVFIDLTSVSVTESEELSELVIYPNPATDWINIEFSSHSTGAVGIRLLDMNGRILIDRINQVSVGQNRFQFNISDVDAGAYLVQLVSGNDLTIKQLLLSK
jgi:PKD repeat protein